MTTKPKAENITLLPYRERVKLVRERLAAMRAPKHEGIPKSQRVLAAEKVMHDYYVRNEAAREVAYEVHRKRKHEVQDALILGDTEKAIKLLREFDT